jgi:hypothetical protein
MQRTLILAIVLFGFAAAHAQTGVQVNGQTSSNTGAGVASDPLSVPTSSLSTLPSLPSSSSTSPSSSSSNSGPINRWRFGKLDRTGGRYVA